MPRLYADRFRTTLATAITTTGQTTFDVATAAGFPTIGATSGDFVILSVTSTDGVTNERMRVNVAPTGNTFTVVRGQDNSTAALFAAGSLVEIRATASSFDGAEDPYNWGQVMLVPPYLNTGAAIMVPVANWTIWHRAMITRAQRISAIAMNITAQSGNIAVGVARGPRGRTNPVDQIATSGSVVCPATGYREIALLTPVVVQPGDWFSIGADNAIAACDHVGSVAGASDNLSFGITTRAASFVTAVGAVPALSNYTRRAPALIGIP